MGNDVAEAGGPSEPSRASARERRRRILDAALRVMARDGLRAVTHRGVATEADVPLSATTYYFRDLEDLLAEAFLHWSRGQQALMEAFHEAASQRVAALRAAAAPPAEIAEAVAAVAATYVVDQVRRQRDDRVLEFAFLHEAVRSPRLGSVVGAQLRAQLEFLERFHGELGSAQPGVDAQLAHGLLLGLEKAALLGVPPPDERERIRAALATHLRRVLAAAAVPL